MPVMAAHRTVENRRLNQWGDGRDALHNGDVRRARSADDSVVKTNGENKRKWWHKWGSRMGGKKPLRRPMTPTPTVVMDEPCSPHLSETGVYEFQKSCSLFEPNKPSLFSMIKDWAKSGLTPRKLGAVGTPRKGRSVGAMYQPQPIPHQALPSTLGEADDLPPSPFAASRNTPRTWQSPGYPKPSNSSIGPQLRHQHEYKGSLQNARVTPLVFDDVFLTSETLKKSMPPGVVGPLGGRKTPPSKSSKVAGCREGKRRGKLEESISSTSGVSHSTRSSAGSSAMGFASSSCMGSSNPSETGPFFTEDLDEQMGGFGVKTATTETGQGYTADPDMPRYSDYIRTVRQVPSGIGENVCIVDTIRSSCFEDDLDSAPSKKPKKLRPKKLLSKLLVKKNSVEVIVEARPVDHCAGRHVIERRTPRTVTPRRSFTKLPAPSDLEATWSWNSGSASASAYSRRQEVLGKIMEKRLNEITDKNTLGGSAGTFQDKPLGNALSHQNNRVQQKSLGPPEKAFGGQRKRRPSKPVQKTPRTPRVPKTEVTVS